MLYWYKTTNNDAPIANLRARREYNTAAEIEKKTLNTVYCALLVQKHKR